VEDSPLREYLDKQILFWRDNLNAHYKTDEGSSLTDYARGALAAYLELKMFLDRPAR